MVSIISSMFVDSEMLKYILGGIACCCFVLVVVAAMYNTRVMKQSIQEEQNKFKEEIKEIVGIKSAIDGKLEIRDEKLHVIDEKVYLGFNITNFSIHESIGCYLKYSFIIDDVPRKHFKSSKINLLPKECRDFYTEKSPLSSSNESYLLVSTGKSYKRKIECAIDLLYGIPSLNFDKEQNYCFCYDLCYVYDQSIKADKLVITKQHVSKED